MKPNPGCRKKIIYFTCISVFCLLLLVICGEMLANLLLPETQYRYSKPLGWAPKANYSASVPVVNQDGQTYTINYSTSEYGFRSFGDLDSDKPRILIIGDSFTDTHTSNQNSYYGIIEKNLPVEIFAFGGSGYGTLQQLMILKKFAKLINPDIFILQFCNNDFNNNSYRLEEEFIARNQRNLRPYWHKGSLTYRTPQDSLLRILYQNSKLFRFFDLFYTNKQFRKYGGYYPPNEEGHDGWGSIMNKGEKVPAYKNVKSAIATTQYLLSEMAKALAPETKLISFTVSTKQKEKTRAWKMAAEKAGFVTYTSVARRVEEAEKSGQVVRIHDGAHWNRLGNAIAGEELSRILREDYLRIISD